MGEKEHLKWQTQSTKNIGKPNKNVFPTKGAVVISINFAMQS